MKDAFKKKETRPEAGRKYKKSDIEQALTRLSPLLDEQGYKAPRSIAAWVLTRFAEAVENGLELDALQGGIEFLPASAESNAESE